MVVTRTRIIVRLKHITSLVPYFHWQKVCRIVKRHLRTVTMKWTLPWYLYDGSKCHSTRRDAEFFPDAFLYINFNLNLIYFWRWTAREPSNDICKSPRTLIYQQCPAFVSGRHVVRIWTLSAVYRCFALLEQATQGCLRSDIVLCDCDGIIGLRLWLWATNSSLQPLSV